MLIGITGKAGSGKDTVADYLVRNHSYKKLAWADPLKAGLAAMGFAEPPDRAIKEIKYSDFDFSWRQAAQRLGTEWGRALDPDIWIKLMARRLYGMQQENILVCGDPVHPVISDVRFENEAAMIRQQGGFVLHLIGRQVDLGTDATHASEAGVACQAGDYRICNTGSLHDLYDQVEEMLQLKEGKAA
jgi:hypothetical protein